MTSHELARSLLAIPDRPLKVETVEVVQYSELTGGEETFFYEVRDIVDLDSRIVLRLGGKEQ